MYEIEEHEVKNCICFVELMVNDPYEQLLWINKALKNYWA